MHLFQTIFLLTLLFVLPSSWAQSDPANHQNINERIASSGVVFHGEILDVSELPMLNNGVARLQVRAKVLNILQTDQFLAADEPIEFELRYTSASFPADGLSQNHALFSKNEVFICWDRNYPIYGLNLDQTCHVFNHSDSLFTKIKTQIHEQQEAAWMEDATDCPANCKLCKLVENGATKKLTRLLRRNVKKRLNSEDSWQNWLGEHDCVKWIIPPDVVLMSIPTWTPYLIHFDTGEERLTLQLTLQLGKTSKFFGLCPEDVNWKGFTDLKVTPNALQGFIDNRRSMYENTLAGADGEISLPYMKYPDEWVIRTYLHRSEKGYFFNLHPSQPNNYEKTVQQLEADSAAMELCLATIHNSMQVRILSLKALANLSDKKTLPYLYSLMKHQCYLDISSLSLSEQESFAAFREELTKCIYAIEGVQTF